MGRTLIMPAFYFLQVYGQEVVAEAEWWQTCRGYSAGVRSVHEYGRGRDDRGVQGWVEE